MTKELPFLTSNHILLALPEDTLGRLRPHLEHVDLMHGDHLYRPYELISHVFFPETAMASMVASTSTGESTEIGVIGWEGMTGVDVLLGVDDSPNECFIQIPGNGWRLNTEVMRSEFARCRAAHDQLLLFTHKLLMQISQTTLCNRMHQMEQRLSRWLLMCRDRSASDDLQLTHEFLGIMLGATRVSVSLSAAALQNLGYIKYNRGRITILDRVEMEKFTCDCYGIVKGEYARN